MGISKDSPLRPPSRMGSEPVHDALVDARLHDLRARLETPRVAGALEERPEEGGRALLPSGRLVHATRARLGHALLALGASVEGSADESDSHTAAV